MVIIIIIILLIILGFIGSYPLAILPIIGYGILIYIYSKKFKDMGNNKFKLNNKDSIMLVVWSSVLMVILIITIVLSGGGSGGSYNGPSDSELNSCRAQSNTYYRCHWATLENRCVCSRR